MLPLTASELLKVWEEGNGKLAYERALLLLSAACPEQSPDELAKLSIGRRDAILLKVREQTFGPKLNCVTSCPACGDRLELDINISDILTPFPELQDDNLHLTLDDYQVDFRIPCTVDLREASCCRDKGRMRTVLSQRCICCARHHNKEIEADELPVHVVEAVAAQVAAHDPQADMQLSLSCPSCNHCWRALFDIVSFFWKEIHVRALQILKEVYILASKYGWRETDILAMSPMRRLIYLEMGGI
jgi:hypothetical protein